MTTALVFDKAAMGRQLLALSPGLRAQMLAEMPDHTVAALVHKSLGTTAYPAVLEALAPERVGRVVLTDLAFFGRAGELHAWRRLELEGKSAAEFNAELAERTVTVTDPTGKVVKVPMVLEPERCWEYLVALCANQERLEEVGHKVHIRRDESSLLKQG